MQKLMCVKSCRPSASDSLSAAVILLLHLLSIAPQVALVLMAAGLPSAAHALTIPRSDNFDGYSAGDIAPSGFIEGGSLSPALITIQNAAPFGKSYRFQLNAAGSLSSVAQFTNVAGKGFTIYAQFSLASFTAAAGNLNEQMVARAADSSAADGYRLSYVLATNVNSPNAARGKLSISRGASVMAYSTGILPPATGVIYTLTLTATYDTPTSMSFVGSLSDGVNAISVSYADTLPPYSGQYFGFRAASDNGGNSADAAFDNFRIAAVGDPAAMAVDFSQSNGILSHRADGFLHGLSATKPLDAIIDQVGVRALRAAPLYLDYDRFVYVRSGNPAFLSPGAWPRVTRQNPVIVGNLAYNTSHVIGKTGSYFPGDGDDWDTWTGIIQQLVTEAEAEGFSGAYSVCNEPNLEFSAHGGPSRFRLAYVYAYNAIKAISPGAKVVGPEISSYDFATLTGFLTFAKTNNALPQVLTWHELIGDPSLIKGHVNEIKAWMTANGASVPEIYITEYGTYNDFTRPGNAGAFISYLEDAGIDYACKANWTMPPYFAVSGNLPSLVTPDGAQLTGVGQVYRCYNQMSGVRAAATAPNPKIVALASGDSSRNSAWVLLSHNDSSVGMQPLSITLKSLPAGLVQAGKTHVKAQLIRDTGIAAATPETIFNGDLIVSTGQAALGLNLDQYESVFLTITPPDGSGAAALAWTVVDDASLAVAYTGGWQAPAEPNYYNGTRHTSGNAGDYAEFTFTGTRLKLYTKKDVNNGIYSVYIDDMSTPRADVDVYAPSPLFQQATYDSQALTPGLHKVRVKVAGRRNGASVGYFIGIDKFEYAP